MKKGRRFYSFHNCSTYLSYVMNFEEIVYGFFNCQNNESLREATKQILHEFELRKWGNL